ncbi:MAG: hypothetical protein JNK82_11245 [Myxococcaceae bacterium]|nr:hypothetical protein [Myxococcaceae bacterium]
MLAHLGKLVGNALAPLTGAVARLRRSRMFHPDGVVYSAEVHALESAPDLRALGERLSGETLSRFSSAWWKQGHEWPDVLGLALRFGGERGDQDLLLATVRFPFTTPVAPLGTRFTSFAWNHFHAVSPFEADGVGRIKLRLRSPRLGRRDSETREQHLARLAEERRAAWLIEARRLEVPFFKRRWEPFAQLELTAPDERVDQAALHFSPFNDRRGLVPVGFVHHLRIGTYASSQRARLATHG